MPTVELRELLHILGRHSRSVVSLLQELSHLDKSVLLQADDYLATIARLHAIVEHCSRRSRPVNKRVKLALIRNAEVSRIMHYALNRLVRRQLSMRVMEAYRRRGELLLQGAVPSECGLLHEQWPSYQRAELWLASTGAAVFPSNPMDGLRLIELWTDNGRPGPL